MLRKNLIFLLLSCYANTVFAQDIVLRGTVRDSLQHSLAYATVLAKPLDSINVVKYTMTNDNGSYNLVLKKNGNYLVSVHFMGYKTAAKKITVSAKNTLDFTLIASVNELEEVVVKLPSAIEVKEDTTTYKTKHFVTGEERKLKDVLKKLPGVEVAKNGTVLFKGKKVKKLLVEGKDFFNGGTKLGVENIPSNVIEKVEMLENYNEVSFLKNLSDDENVAMNIVLKKDKKRFAFGDIEAGVGTDTHYKAKASIFYYSPKTSINTILSSNNVGEKALTFKDYINFEGGINSIFENGFSFKNFNFQQFTNLKETTASKQNFVALNIIKNTKKKWTVSSYFIHSFDTNDALSQTNNQYLNFDEAITNNQANKYSYNIINFKAKHTPSSSSTLNLKTIVKFGNNRKEKALNTTINANDNIINTLDEQPYFTVNQNVTWHKQLTANHTFSTLATYSYNEYKGTTLWTTNNTILQGLLPLDTNQSLYRINQDKNNYNQEFNFIFKYFWVLNRLNHIYTTLGVKNTKTNFSTKTTQSLDNGNIVNFGSSGYDNDLKNNWNKNFIKLQYKTKQGVFTIKPGVSLEDYQWRNVQENTTKKSKTRLVPELLVKVKFLSAKTINFTYKYNISFFDTEKLANRFYLSAYNMVRKGNPLLDESSFHTATINYRSNSIYRGLALYGNLKYTKRINAYKTVVSYVGTDRYLTTNLVVNPDKNVKFNGYIYKKIKKIKYKLDTDFSYTDAAQIVNNTRQNNTNKRYSYKLSIQTLSEKYPTITMGYKQSYSFYKNGARTSSATSQNPFINATYDFWKYYDFSFDYDFVIYQSATSQSTSQLMDFSFFYTPAKSPWTFRLTAKNILNANYNESNVFSDYYIGNTKSYIMPRIVLLTASYKL